MSATSPTETARPTLPDALGRFGEFGGRYVPETLMDALNRLAEAYEEARADPAFQAELESYWEHYVGRPSPLFHAERLSSLAGGAAIYLKREDLNHTGAHKINNAIGQVMLARRMSSSPM
jgi:tryptophan synthase beta chain